MATEDDTEDTTGKEDQDDTGKEDQDDTGTEGKEGEGEAEKDKVDPELAKAIKRRDAANAAKNKALEEVAALRDKYEKDKTDPLAMANSRLVKAEARTVLTVAGVEKADQAAVMGYLNLSEVTVSADGEVDTEAIQDAVDDLKRIFSKAPAKKSTPRIDPRDKGGNTTKPEDAATERRRRMLQGN